MKMIKKIFWHLKVNIMGTENQPNSKDMDSIFLDSKSWTSNLIEIRVLIQNLEI